jgi:tripeptidyl-peptidase-1
MLGRSIFLSAAVAAQTILGTPIRARTEYSVKETYPIPRGWSPAGRAPGNHMLHLQIGLKQENFDELERHLYEGIFAYYICAHAVIH